MFTWARRGSYIKVADQPQGGVGRLLHPRFGAGADQAGTESDAHLACFVRSGVKPGKNDGVGDRGREAEQGHVPALGRTHKSIGQRRRRRRPKRVHDDGGEVRSIGHAGQHETERAYLAGGPQAVPGGEDPLAIEERPRRHHSPAIGQV